MSISKNEFNGLVARVALLEVSLAALGGRESPSGLSAPHKAKLSKAMKGNKNAAGRKSSVEHRRKLSHALMGNKNGAGWKPTPEQRRKISKALKGNRNAAKAK